MAKVALLIGVSEYEPGLNPLPGAVKDVDAIREVLLHPEMGGFIESDIVSLKNPERQDVEEAIESVFSYRQKDDLVLLYFSGHGIKDDQGQLYLATRRTRKNSKGQLVRATAIAASFIQQCMSNSRSRRQVVILDSCFSGAFAEGLSAKDDGSVEIREQLGGEGRAVLTSSSSTQYSFEEQGQDLSIYTRFLIEGIKSGEADRDEDEFITIDELHEYASQKVRELQPAMKPEIYAIREGFKIRLSKVAPGDPIQKYRKEVSRFIHRGEISFVGRRTLDVLKTRLGLEATEAKAIEDEVLEPYRKEFNEKLQQYEQVFTDLLERDEKITEADRNDLQNLQQILGLRNEDTMPIEAEVTAKFKAHQENLQTYAQAFCSAVWQEYPLSEANCNHLREIQQQLNLTVAEVEKIESRFIAEVQIYHQKLQEYERLFIDITQHEYPLSEVSRANLRQQQEQLGLKDSEIAPIEAKITTQVESYQQKLQQYEQAYIKATQRKNYPNEVTRKQLKQTWQTLELSEIDVETIESRISTEIKTYQENLRQYEQIFSEAVQQEYPLSSINRDKLTEHYRSLHLSVEDVEAIENSLVREIKEHQQKLQQYEQVFRESIQFEYPLNEVTRVELSRFQQILELRDEEVAQIERQVTSQNKRDKNQSAFPISQTETLPGTQTSSQAIEVEVQETQNSRAFQEYKLQFAKYMQHGMPLDDYYLRSQLKKLQRRLQLTDKDINQIEQQVLSQRQSESSQTLYPLPVEPPYQRDAVNSSKEQQDNKAKALNTLQNASHTHDSYQQFAEQFSPLSPTRRIAQQSFFLVWTLAYAFGTGGGWALVGTMTLNGTLSYLFCGAVVGLGLGLAQWLILRIFDRRMKLWVFFTMVGYSMGFAMAGTFLGGLHGTLPLVLLVILYGSVIGIMLGLAQWIALKPLIQQSKIWLLSVPLAETVGNAFGWGIITNLPVNPVISGAISGVISGAISGLITGKVMLRLLSLKKVS